MPRLGGVGIAVGAVVGFTVGSCFSVLTTNYDRLRATTQCDKF